MKTGLKLDLNALEVETFTAADDDGQRGTVMGNVITVGACPTVFCDTSERTCGDTCGNETLCFSCANTCASCRDTDCYYTCLPGCAD
ncbi:MAG: hypothetical protein JO306_00480 [Gemmatimonadetes bacterium]|nr:hypothetical protein [Gemmatimonadota bacterium]